MLMEVLRKMREGGKGAGKGGRKTRDKEKPIVHQRKARPSTEE